MRFLAYKQSTVCGFKLTKHDHKMVNFQSPPKVFGPEENYPASQPVNFVEGNEPPLLLLYGNDNDTLRAFNIESLTKKVKQAGGCVESHYYDGLDHAGLIGALALPLQNSSSVLSDIAGFLDRHANDQRSC